MSDEYNFNLTPTSVKIKKKKKEYMELINKIDNDIALIKRIVGFNKTFNLKLEGEESLVAIPSFQDRLEKKIYSIIEENKYEILKLAKNKIEASTK